MPLDVIEQFAAAAGHGDQPPAGVIVLAVDFQVLGEMGDPGGKKSDLHFGGAGIFLVDFELLDYFTFWIGHDIFVMFTASGVSTRDS